MSFLEAEMGAAKYEILFDDGSVVQCRTHAEIRGRVNEHNKKAVMGKHTVISALHGGHSNHFKRSLAAMGIIEIRSI